MCTSSPIAVASRLIERTACSRPSCARCASQACRAGLACSCTGCGRRSRHCAWWQRQVRCCAYRCSWSRSYTQAGTCERCAQRSASSNPKENAAAVTGSGSSSAMACSAIVASAAASAEVSSAAASQAAASRLARVGVSGCRHSGHEPTFLVSHSSAHLEWKECPHGSRLFHSSGHQASWHTWQVRLELLPQSSSVTASSGAIASSTSGARVSAASLR
mmetsp:Transcript_49751/g.111845  ORF Transcript_49751/g.111845 Transcript_49751/m.111845 type:complete len:218 (-) Transcript_49751:484-1137(-)